MPRFQLYYQLDVDTRSRICNGDSWSERRSALSVAIALRELLRFRHSELCQFVKLSPLSVSNGHGTRFPKDLRERLLCLFVRSETLNGRLPLDSSSTSSMHLPFA